MMLTKSMIVVVLLAGACGGEFPAPHAQPVTPPDSAAPAGPANPAGPAPSSGPAPSPQPAPAPPPAPPPAPSIPPPPRGPTFAGCPVFPPESAWNRDISSDPVDPHSADYLWAMHASSLRLWPDLGTPITVVGGGQRRVPMTFTWAASSDPGPYPFPPNVGKTYVDGHAVVLDRDACTLYETYNTWPDGAGGYRADVGAVWNLWSAALRPDGWTSATAAGLPLLAGIIKYEEAQELGEIRHALVFASPATAHSYVHPATHSSGTSYAAYAPPMGLRIRLRADFDLSRFSGPSRAVLIALRKHGAFITDNQSGLPFWPIWGAQDSRWDMANLEQLKSVPTSAFEVVRLGQVRPGS